jgi:hypothetical protein
MAPLLTSKTVKTDHVPQTVHVCDQDPVNSNVPDGDYSHIPINDEMVDLLADGIIASGAEVLADPTR